MPTKTRPPSVKTFARIYRAPSGDFNNPNVAQTRSETISWEAGGRSAINRCTHTKVESSPLPVNQKARNKVENRQIELIDWGYNLQHDLVISSVLGAAKPHYPNLDRLYKGRVGALANSFSGTNFLLELGDVPELLKGLPLLHAAESLSKGKRIEAGKNLFLANELALQPFIGDLQGLYDIWKRFSRSRQQFEKTLRKQEPIKASRSGSNKVDLLLFDFLRVRGTVNWQTKAGALITGKMSTPAGLYPVLNALDAFGLYVDASAGWNALPFSFVVDYVLPIGNTLEKFRDPYVGVTTQMVRAWQTLKLEAKVTCTWEEPDTWEAPINGSNLGTVSIKSFNRGPADSSVPDDWPAFRLPGFRQGAIAAALSKR